MSANFRHTRRGFLKSIYAYDKYWWLPNGNEWWWRSGNDSFSPQGLEMMPIPASFHILAVPPLKMANEPGISTCHWRPHLSLFQIQMLNASKQPMSDHSSNAELSPCAKQGRRLIPVESSCYSWNRKLNFPTCKWNWKPLLPTPKGLKKKKKRLSIGSTFKYTKYFSSFLVLGISLP